jgi:hypothetical protein
MNRDGVAAKSSCCFGVAMHLHAWMEFCRHLGFGDAPSPFPSTSQIGRWWRGIGNKARWNLNAILGHGQSH